VGGGVFSPGNLTATNCLFDSCTADSGGAIVSAGKLRLVRCTLSGNVGVGAALQLWNGADSASVLDCTIAANGGSAPAVLNQGAMTVDVGNTVLAANAGGDAVGAFHSIGFNLVGNSTGATGFSTGVHDIMGTSGAPLNPHLGPLQDNGGPTLTLMPAANSPLIDAGHSLVAEFLDARGHVRKLDNPATPNAAGSDLTDIGDVEVGPPTHWSVLNLLDHGSGSLRQAAITAAPFDSVTFDPGVTGTIQLTRGEVFVHCGFSIYGPGPNALEIDGGGLRPVLSVPGPASSNIKGLHLSHGAVTAALDLAPGAAITVDLMAITDSRTTGIRNGGSLVIARSLITGCNAAAPPPNVESNGGGVLMVGLSTLYVINSTFAADTASNGGAISNPGGFIEVHNSTIVDTWPSAPRRARARVEASRTPSPPSCRARLWPGTRRSSAGRTCSGTSTASG
jgi:hypothetical protein